MIEISNSILPTPDDWAFAIQGMRNPLDSWDKSDSRIHRYYPYSYNEIKEYDIQGNDYTLSSQTHFSDVEGYAKATAYDVSQNVFVLEDKDRNLLLNLCKAGSEHRKVLRQLDVRLRITAPLYFWKQIDAYKVGITMNSCSTMHTITKKEFTEDDFSIEPYRHEDEEIEWSGGLECMQTGRINLLNSLRAKYLETKDKYYWQKIIEFLPESYNQTRNIVVNYEWIINYIFQRRGHKLPEHDVLCSWLIANVPLVKEIVEAIEGKE